jgi:hypothetical protein
MRPSKLRLPESTPQTSRLPVSTAFAIAGQATDRSYRCRSCSRNPLRLKPRPSRSFAEIGLVEIICDHLRAGRERGFHPRFAFEARASALRARRPAATRTDGFEVFVQDVIAAMTTSPSSPLVFLHRQPARSLSTLRRWLSDVRGKRVRLGEFNFILRTFRTGKRRLHARHVEFQRVGEDRIGRGRIAPHALFLRVLFDQFHAVRRGP